MLAGRQGGRGNGGGLLVEGGGGEVYTRWKHTSGVMGTVIVPDIFNIRIDEFSNRRCIS